MLFTFKAFIANTSPLGPCTSCPACSQLPFFSRVPPHSTPRPFVRPSRYAPHPDNSFSSWKFSLFVVFNRHVLRYCASAIFTCFSFMAFLIASLHLSFGLPIFRCPPTSIFPVVITIYSSVFLSTWPNHLSLASLICFTYVCHTCPGSLLFLHSWSSQSSLCPSSISRHPGNCPMLRLILLAA